MADPQTMDRTPTLRRALVVALVVPAVLVVAVVAVVADFVARRALEDALGKRLISVGQAASTQLTARVLLLERGDDDTRVKRNALTKLQDLQATTEVERIVVVRSPGDQVLVDTAAEWTIGTEYPRARFDRPELDQVAEGSPAASVLFTGPTGDPYKTGYAPFVDKDGKISGYVGVKAPASYTAAIDRLRGTMAAVAGGGLLLLLAAAGWSARRIAVPLSALSEAAAAVGTGRWDTEIPIGGPHEARVLAMTMQHMTTSLQARDDEMQMMLASIAHEVRNPLGGIELFGGLLKEDLEDDPRQKHVLKILRELGTLSRVVNDFLDFARRRAPELRKVSVHELAFEIISLAEKDATDRSVTLKLDIPKDLDIDVDPEQIKRALLNLVRNAIQAAPTETGRVMVTARQDGPFTVIEVIDNGDGVPEDKKKDIFTPFFTTKQKGTGLGLALVKKATEEHRGTIGVTDAEGGGARFTLRLPKGSTEPT